MNKHVLYQEVASTTTRTNSKAQRAFIVCIALIMGVFITGRAKAQNDEYFAGGSGTSDEPYIIQTAAQLAQLATLVNAGNAAYNDQLAGNIDLADYGAEFNTGRGWIYLSKYFQIFISDDHCVACLFYDGYTAGDAGFF